MKTINDVLLENNFNLGYCEILLRMTSENKIVADVKYMRYLYHVEITDRESNVVLVKFIGGEY